MILLTNLQKQIKDQQNNLNFFKTKNKKLAKMEQKIKLLKIKLPSFSL
jgi:hypothetical protein